MKKIAELGLLALSCLLALPIMAGAREKSAPWNFEPQVVERKRQLAAAPGEVERRRTFAVDVDERQWFMPEELPEREAMVFALRDALERKGYESVNLREEPDFLVRMSASSVPFGEVDPTRTRGEAHGHSDRQQHPVHVPGLDEPNTAFETSGGFTGRGWEARLETSVEIDLVEPASGDLLWTVAGTVVARESELDVAGQLLVDHVLRGLPATRQGNGHAEPLERAGLHVVMLTEDGTTYWPTVVTVAPDGAAEKAGLRPGDRLVQLAGESTRNRTVRWVEDRLAAELESTTVLVEVYRAGRVRSVQLAAR